MASLIAAAKDDGLSGRDRSRGFEPPRRRRARARARAKASRPPSSITRRYGKDREAFERALQDVLDAHRIELVCLGRLHAAVHAVVRAANGKGGCSTSTLPCCPRSRASITHERALEAGVKTHGATVHFVIPEIDSGPIIAQAEVPVLADDTAETLAARVLEVEHRIYPQALRQVAEGRAPNR